MDSNVIREHLESMDREVLLMEGLDDALIGVSQRINEPFLAVYSWEKIIEVLMERDGMDFDEAVEFSEFNIIGAWVGEKTPIIVMPLDW